MNGFFRQLDEALARGPVALATVVAARGSTPRTVGARQFLAADGAIAGTIGGGVTESRVLALARETLTDGRARTFEADLRGRPDDVRDGVCGGTMSVCTVRLDPSRDLELVRAVDATLRAGQRVTLATSSDAAAPLSIVPASEPADETAFAETLRPPPRLLVVGAGHIGRALAHLVEGLGFVVSVQDDRPEWLVPAAFPADCRLDPQMPAAAAALAGWEGERFAALVTRGFAQDLDALGVLAGVPELDYLGVLGSRTRVATVMTAWKRTGRSLPPDDVLHAPIGIEIGAETPEEIAVSIAAEIIRVLRRRNPR